MIAVEALYLTALLSAFIGLIALFVLAARPSGGQPPRLKGFLGSLVILTAVVAVGTFLVYALSPHDAARSVYGAVDIERILV